MELDGFFHVGLLDVFAVGEVGDCSGDFEAGGDGAGRKAVAQGGVVERFAAIDVEGAMVENLLRRETRVFDTLTFALSLYGACNILPDFFGRGEPRTFFYFTVFFTFIFNEYTKVDAVEQRRGKLFPVLLDALEAAKTDFRM